MGRHLRVVARVGAAVARATRTLARGAGAGAVERCDLRLFSLWCGCRGVAAGVILSVLTSTIGEDEYLGMPALLDVGCRGEALCLVPDECLTH